MMTIIKCFSVLIASGKGSRCAELRTIIQDELLATDEQTGKLKVLLFKYGKKISPNDFRRVSIGLAQSVSPLYSDVDTHFFGNDGVVVKSVVSTTN